MYRVCAIDLQIIGFKGYKERSTVINPFMLIVPTVGQYKKNSLKIHLTVKMKIYLNACTRGPYQQN